MDVRTVLSGDAARTDHSGRMRGIPVCDDSAACRMHGYAGLSHVRLLAKQHASKRLRQECQQSWPDAL